MVTTLVVGLVLGGTFALMALGLTIQYGVARIMNLAYGEFVIGGAFLTYLAVAAAGLDPFLAFLLVVPLGYAASWLCYALIMRPLERRSRHHLARPQPQHRPRRRLGRPRVRHARAEALTFPSPARR